MIRRESLLSLEAYAKQRSQFRAKVMEHKKRRTVHLGGNLTLQFEDELTVRYQVQEMLRIERIFEEEGIRHELDAYNPLVPDGGNWKATMMIEYPEPDERRAGRRSPVPGWRPARDSGRSTRDRAPGAMPACCPAASAAIRSGSCASRAPGRARRRAARPLCNACPRSSRSPPRPGCARPACTERCRRIRR